jgi:hypothetical protein
MNIGGGDVGVRRQQGIGLVERAGAVVGVLRRAGGNDEGGDSFGRQAAAPAAFPAAP